MMRYLPNRFRYPLPLWEAACDEVRAILIRVARERQTITYGELAKRIETIPIPSGHDVRLNQMLGSIGKFEDDEGRPMLNVLVICRDPPSPGKGFFDWSRQLGRTVRDELEFQSTETQACYEYWAEHSKKV
jgi:hypothetical protein